MPPELPVKLEEIQDRIRERIKAAFMDLIPEEKWDEIIKNEVNALMLDREETRGYDRKIIPSPLKKMVQDLIKEEFKKKLQIWADSNLLHLTCASDFDAKFKDLVLEASKVYQDQIGEEIVKRALQAFSSQLKNCTSCGHIGVIPGTQCSGCGVWN